MTSQMVQALVDHGRFMQYLFRFKLRDSPYCACDRAKIQDLLHVLEECGMFLREHAALGTGIDVQINFFQGQILSFPRRGKSCSSRPIKAGVLRGSIALTYIALHVTNDILRYPKVELALFSDDTTLYTLDAQPRALAYFQIAIDILSDWSRE
ncbi:hypothetical protein EVAR_10442_1 [Eumeta japonica]|uniref:Uncharacterized protein n=1 Tax=Eumeta variegata TaxID=151549 RepID=A0A4C1TI58_EUMVA|nr:hypothetical protein EVAR_10442_1 [Eumeta japonica]